MAKPSLEKKILKTVQQLPDYFFPRELADKVSKNPVQAKEAREMIRSLINQGLLQVTLDWKLRVG